MKKTTMRSFLLLFVFLLIFFYSGAQTNVYHPFPDSNAIWVGRHWYNYPPTCMVYDDFDLYISGDTIIGNYTYHKLYKNGHKWASCPPPGFYYYGQYWGAFRQDKANKKVYLFYNGKDTLAYNFDLDLNVGDTLPPSCLVALSPKNYIQSIDSVLIGSQYRKRFWISQGVSHKYTALIEGIGTTLGAFASIIPPFEAGDNLWCVRINDQIVWTETGHNCDLMSITESSIAKNQTSIFPNPSNGTFNMISSEQICNIEVFDLLGNCRYQCSKPERQINLSDQPKGIYFIRLVYENRTTTTEKLIISD
jgi:hypothetical protein